MKYNLSTTNGIAEANKHLARLVVEQKTVDIKEVKPRRSLPQNSYLHLLLGAFGAHFGYTLEESKALCKQLPGNKELYVYQKDVGGKPMTFLKSSADMTKEEMTKTIETLREWSARLGYPLPAADNTQALDYLENLIEQNGRYL